MRENATSCEVAINILKAGAEVNPNALPSVIHPKELDALKQWYLFQEVAPYCLNKESCSMPTEPKPVVKIDSPMVARICSKRKMTGHNKINCTK